MTLSNPYLILSLMQTKTSKCGKCDGRGQYLHFGVCYQCDGTGVISYDESLANARRMPRAQVIADLAAVFARMAEDPECTNDYLYLIGPLYAHADADVQDRARTRLVALGYKRDYVDVMVPRFAAYELEVIRTGKRPQISNVRKGR